MNVFCWSCILAENSNCLQGSILELNQFLSVNTQPWEASNKRQWSVALFFCLPLWRQTLYPFSSNLLMVELLFWVSAEQSCPYRKEHLPPASLRNYGDAFVDGTALQVPALELYWCPIVGWEMGRLDSSPFMPAPSVVPGCIWWHSHLTGLAFQSVPFDWTWCFLPVCGNGALIPIPKVIFISVTFSISLGCLSITHTPSPLSCLLRMSFSMWLFLQ